MPKQINNADASQVLAAAYALKGKVSLQLDEIVVPVAIVDDLSAENPPVELRPCQADINQAPVAAEFSYIGVQTQAAFSLLVEFFDMFNTGTWDDCSLVSLSVANLTTIGISAGALITKDLPRAALTVGSQFWFGTHATELGILLGDYVIRAEQTTRIPVGSTLYGLTNTDRRAIAIRAANQNARMHGVAICVERDLPVLP